VGLVVQKFGGTSVANAEKVLAAARRAIRAKLAGHQVAVVVSARGHTTDELIDLAREIHPSPPSRELDQLLATGEQVSIALMAMAIDFLGHRAVSLTGGQIGIVTDSVHGKARIRSIDTTRLRTVLNAGNIAIVAGFQGIDADGNIMTLGRGGSDTTAVAVAAALGADVCEIYTDVDGVFTTDPRLVPEARRLERISYDEMLELASAGAGVMHSRSIEFAKKFGVVTRVRHSGHDGEGTEIRPESPIMEHTVVRGAAIAKEEARITFRSLPADGTGVDRIFTRLAENHVVVDMIVRNATTDGRSEISFTVTESDLARTLELAEPLVRETGAASVDHSTDVAKVSVVGLGMRTHSGVARRMFTALAAAKVNILMISTSEIKISVLVLKDEAPRALRAVHAEFELDKPFIEAAPETPRRPGSGGSADGAEERLKEIARSLPTMEDILVSDVESDERQGRVTVFGVPDRPGFASQVFSKVAEAGIPVDMIVQSAGTDGCAHISFTVMREDLAAAGRCAEEAMASLGGGKIETDAEMVKIAVRGVGMRTHTGVAFRMFRALASRNIPLPLINTSELHITVAVGRAHAPAALSAIRETFGLER
jgi:aspartate kinase